MVDHGKACCEKDVNWIDGNDVDNHYLDLPPRHRQVRLFKVAKVDRFLPFDGCSNLFRFDFHRVSFSVFPAGIVGFPRNHIIRGDSISPYKTYLTDGSTVSENRNRDIPTSMFHVEHFRCDYTDYLAPRRRITAGTVAKISLRSSQTRYRLM